MFSSQGLPLISIIVASYNYGKYIERAIKSVLRQDYPAKELIIIDGGSTDETIDVLQRYPQIKWVSEPDKGIPDAWNKGLARASGQIIGTLGADDYYAPGAFSYVAKTFKEKPDTLMVAGYRANINEKLDITSIARLAGPLTLRHLLEGAAVPYQEATFYPRQVIERVGGLNVNVHYVCDFDLQIKILCYGDGTSVNRVLAFYLEHPDQVTQAKNQLLSPDLNTAIKDWMSSDCFSPELRNRQHWLEACIYVKQAFWLKRGGSMSEAASKLLAAKETFPDCQKWPAYQWLAKAVGLLPEKLSNNKYWQLTLSGLSALRSRQFRRVLDYLIDTVYLKLKFGLPDPRWIYKNGA